MMIRKALTYIGIITLMVMTGGCSSSEGDDSTSADVQSVLSIYVYAPEQPLATRADEGAVTATYSEKAVTKLQLWVFEHTSGALVAYYSPESTETLNSGGSAVYQVSVADDFADRRPDVDVYVLANVAAANTGKAFDESTTRAALDAAVMDNSFFGLSATAATGLTSAVPADGLPMSGVLKNQKVTGERPVLRIGESYADMATVRLARMVSKLRFVFCNMTGNTVPVSITGITLDGRQMANAEYLCLEDAYTGRNTHISSYLTSDYAAAPMLAAPLADSDIKKADDPTAYVFQEAVESAQTYEERMAAAIADGKVTLVGPYYLHESDKQLTGTISYMVEGMAKPDVPFTLMQAGDFSRNHTWLVYAFFGGSMLELNVVSTGGWKEKDPTGQEWYNW